MKRSGVYLASVVGLLGVVALISLATWVRPETTAVGGLFLGAALVLVGCIVRRTKCEGCDFLDVSMVAFIGYMLWRATSSEVAMYAKMDTFLLLVVGGCWLLRPYLSAAAQMYRKVWIVVLACFLCVNGIASFYQLSEDSQWGLFVQRTAAVEPYASGIFSHYNYFANFCLVSAVSALAGVFDTREKKSWRGLSSFVVVGNIALVALSHSRGGFLACAAGISVFLLLTILSFNWKSRPPSKKPLLLAGGVFFVMLGGLVWLATLGESRGWFSQSNTLLDNGRIAWSALAVDQFWLAPWLGSGAHSYEWKTIELWPSWLTESLRTMDYVHNEYLQLLAEYGAVGMLLFLAVLGTMIWYGVKRIFDSSISEGERYWSVSAIAVVVAFGTHSFFSFVGHIPALVTLLLVVVVLGLVVNPASPRAFALPVGFVRKGALVACGGVIGMLSLSELPAFSLYTKSNDTHEVDYSENFAQLKADLIELQEVVEKAPNFKRYEKLGLLASQAHLAESNPEEKQRYLDLSISAFENEVALYPMAPMARVNLARVLGWADRDQEATDHYEYLILHAAKREYWTNANWHYAEHCFKLGEAKWYERKSDEALYYFLKSQDLLLGTRTYRFPKTMPKLLKKRVRLLQDAGFSPVKPEEAP